MRELTYPAAYRDESLAEAGAEALADGRIVVYGWLYEVVRIDYDECYIWLTPVGPYEAG